MTKEVGAAPRSSALQHAERAQARGGELLFVDALLIVGGFWLYYFLCFDLATFVWVGLGYQAPFFFAIAAQIYRYQRVCTPVGVVHDTLPPSFSLWLTEPQRKTSFPHSPTSAHSAPDGRRA